MGKTHVLEHNQMSGPYQLIHYVLFYPFVFESFKKERGKIWNWKRKAKSWIASASIQTIQEDFSVAQAVPQTHLRYLSITSLFFSSLLCSNSFHPDLSLTFFFSG